MRSPSAEGFYECVPVESVFQSERSTAACVPAGNLETPSFSCIRGQPNGESCAGRASVVRVYKIMFFC